MPTKARLSVFANSALRAELCGVEGWGGGVGGDGREAGPRGKVWEEVVVGRIRGSEDLGADRRWSAVVSGEAVASRGWLCQFVWAAVPLHLIGWLAALCCAVLCCAVLCCAVLAEPFCQTS